MSHAMIIWIGVIVSTLVVELITPQVVSIWFTLGGIVALALELLGVTSMGIQFVAFLVISFGLLGAIRPKIADKLKKTDKARTNYDRYIGKSGVVLLDIKPDIKGRVLVDGLAWQACSDTELKVGTKIKVISIEGVTVKVEAI